MAKIIPHPKNQDNILSNKNNLIINKYNKYKSLYRTFFALFISSIITNVFLFTILMHYVMGR